MTISRDNRRVRRSITTLRDAKEFIRTSGSPVFDDMRSMNFVQVPTEYPGMLPEGFKMNIDGDFGTTVDLHREGSIVIDRTAKPGLFDSCLNDFMLLKSRRPL